MSTIATADTVTVPYTPAPSLHQKIPASRVVGVELRKMFDTRAGFWMMMSIGIAAVLATGAVIAFAPDSSQTYESFASAFGFPMAVILPMIAILSVTSEWSQRSGLSTFTLVPHRGRVIAAKGAATLVVAVASMALAFGIGAVGNLLGSVITGNDLAWDISMSEVLYILAGNTVGMAMGFMLGVLLRNSSGAIVAYFVYSLLLPTISGILASAQEWWGDLMPWVDFNYNQNSLFEGGFTGENWAQFGVAGLIWFVAPLAIGLWLLMRSEVK